MGIRLRNRTGFGLSSAATMPLLLPLLGLVLAGILAGGAMAQQAPAQEPKAVPPVAAAPAKPQAQAQGQSPGQSKPSQPPAGGDAGLKARVESLEEQLVDMQVVVGTLESLAKSGGTSSSPAYRAAAGSDGGRVDGLENQVKTLSAQVQQLSDQVRSLGGTPRRADATPPPAPRPVSEFGSTTVSEGDPISGMIAGDAPPVTSGPPIPGAGGPGTGGPDAGSAGVGASGNPGAGAPSAVTTAALPPPGDGSNPKQLYETAYGYLLQRDYGAAEAAFDDFLKRHPSDSLSGNAQYWLGESHFVRGQYKAAASAFLKGYQTYGQSQKAPDSLLKLAMSLDRLGQRDAACSSYAELNTKFPNAPQSVKARAQSERQRVGCP